MYAAGFKTGTTRIRIHISVYIYTHTHMCAYMYVHIHTNVLWAFGPKVGTMDRYLEQSSMSGSLNEAASQTPNVDLSVESRQVFLVAPRLLRSGYNSEV